MDDPRKMQFFVIRYAPYLQWQINVGVVLFENLGGSVTFAKARFTNNMQWISQWDPEADIPRLKSLIRDIEGKINSVSARDEILSLMQATFSNAIQLSEAEAVLVSGDPNAELDTLASLYLPNETTPKPS